MIRISALALAAAGPLLMPQQRFTSGVELVRVDALVTDGRRAVAGLTATDFELRDNGVVQTIDTVGVELQPLSVILVLDISGSVAGGKMANLTAAVDQLLSGLQAMDRAALVTFSHRVWVRTPLVTDFASLHSMLSKAEAAGGTSLYDAVYAALALSDVQGSRPLLVVFSDGLDNASWLSAEVVESAARRANAVVYGVAVAASTRTVVRLDRTAPGGRSVDSQPQYQKGQTEFLDSIATTTGGRLLKADAVGNVQRAFDDILREFRTRYLITYRPHGVGAGGWHRIDVRVTSRSAHVTARSGYQR